MSNEIKAPRLLGNYGGHTFDGHLTLAIMKTCEEDKNLITDSNFQNGNGNWNQPEFFEGGIASLIEDKTAKTGDRCIKLQANNPFGQRVWAVLWFDVEPDTTYYLGAVVRGDKWNDTNKCDMTLGFVNPETGKFLHNNTGGSLTDESQKGFAFDGNWHIVKNAFYSGNLNKIGIGFCGSSFSAYVDSLTLYKMEDAIDYKFPKRDAEGGKLVNLNPPVATCDDAQNLFENHDLEGGDYSFWESGVSFGMTATLGCHDDAHGTSLHYTENTYGTDTPKQTYYIKWLDVEKNTNYTFAAEYCTAKEGKGWFGVMTGNAYLPTPIQKYFFNTFEDAWCPVAVTFNTGDYDRIGFVVCDCGGEGYIDNLYFFKA